MELLRSLFRDLPDGPAADVAAWRQRILDASLYVACCFGLGALVPGLIITVQNGQWALAALDTAVYSLLVLVTARKDLSFSLRAGSVTAGVYVFAVLMLVKLGPGGSGLLYLGTVPVIAAVHFGMRGAAAAILGQALTLAAFALAILSGHFTWAPRPGASEAHPVFVWLVIGANLIFLSAVVSLSISALLRGLYVAIASERRSMEALERERARLEEAYASLSRESTERGQLELQLRQAQKLEALGTLAGGIAHDFNNLLQPIMAHAEIVQSRLPSDNPDRDRLEHILRSAERARDMVRRILTFSRRVEPKRGSIRLADPVRDVAALLRTTLPANIRLVVTVRDEEACIHAESTEVVQVLMNLAMNAYHAMRADGGLLEIVVDRRTSDPWVRLSVRDTGAGMDQATIDRAFDPFFTTKPAGEGTGLGLSTVHGIVTSLRGRIALQSQPGQGTTVDVSLPRLAVPGIGVTAEHRVARPASARVLLVDDEESVLAVAGTQLRHLGYHVESARDPLAALGSVQRNPGAFDVVITDQGMPGMSGVSLTQEIRVTEPDLPVVLMTGFLDEPTRIEAEQAGVSAVLPKPFRLGDLTEVLGDVLIRRVALSG